jgi:hypothetical protein
VLELARQRIFYVNKLKFLHLYPRVRQTALSEQNIQAGFRATGLVLYDLERVISCLTLVRTPSPLGVPGSELEWTAETPHTAD